MIAKTLMCITFFLFLYLSSSSLKEQSHDSRIQFLRVWDEENLADLIVALRQTLNVDERTVIDTVHYISVRSRKTQRVSRWYASHKAVPVRFALLWRWSSFFIHDVHRIYFTKESLSAIISSKVVSHRSVFVTFDLIIVTKILEHKTNEIDDAEEKWDKTPKRDRDIASKLYVQSVVLRHQSRSFQKKGAVTLRTTRQIIFIELFDRNSMRRSGGRLSINASWTFLCSVDYAFFLSFIFSLSK